MAPKKRSAVEEDTVKPINTTTTASRVTRSSARRLNGSSVADSVEPAPADLPKKKKAKTAAKEKGKSAESAEAENAKPKAVAGSKTIVIEHWMATTSVHKDSTASTTPQAGKHQWTPGEDKRLVESLYELYTMGTWKCDTGFKSGYLLQLEKMLAQKIPSTGVRVCSHIESRVKTLKKQTMAIAEMFTTGSGFSWNDVDKRVEADKIVYDLWVKSHPAAKGLQNKSFPHYDTLLEIFGKDRANGLSVTTLATEEEAIEATAANEFNGSTQFDDGLEGIEVSSTQPQPSQAGTSLGKRKSSDGWTRGMLDVLASIKTLVDGTIVYLDKIGNAMSEESTLTKQIAEEVQKIDGLSLLDILNVGKDISKDLYMSNVFLSLPDAKRKEMVYEMLKRRNPTG